MENNENTAEYKRAMKRLEKQAQKSALNLIKKFYDTKLYNKHASFEDEFKHAQQCALLTVNTVLNSVAKCGSRNGGMIVQLMVTERIDGWKKVRGAIKKMNWQEFGKQIGAVI